MTVSSPHHPEDRSVSGHLEADLCPGLAGHRSPVGLASSYTRSHWMRCKASGLPPLAHPQGTWSTPPEPPQLECGKLLARVGAAGRACADGQDRHARLEKPRPG